MTLFILNLLNSFRMYVEWELTSALSAFLLLLQSEFEINIEVIRNEEERSYLIRRAALFRNNQSFDSIQKG